MNGAAPCWALSDGKPGMLNQCLGLAEAVGVEFVVKTVRPLLPWRVLPPHLWLAPLSAPGPSGDQLVPPWPELLIATGRPTVALSLAIKRASRGRTFTVQIQNPTRALSRFDLVAAPRHDNLVGDNVIVTEGAVHRVTAERLAEEAERFRPLLQDLPRPLVAVLIGGSNRQYRFTRDAAQRLADGLARLGQRHGAGLAITTSRRTGEENERLLREALGGRDVYFWDGSGDNPYFGFLGLADAIVATSDSVSMVSEACSTGKPVYIFDPEGGSDKFRRFHLNLRQAKMTRPFTGDLESWSYDPLDDTGRVAREVHRRMRRSATGD